MLQIQPKLFAQNCLSSYSTNVFTCLFTSLGRIRHFSCWKVGLYFAIVSRKSRPRRALVRVVSSLHTEGGARCHWFGHSTSRRLKYGLASRNNFNNYFYIVTGFVLQGWYWNRMLKVLTCDNAEVCIIYRPFPSFFVQFENCI